MILLVEARSKASVRAKFHTKIRKPEKYSFALSSAQFNPADSAEPTTPAAAATGKNARNNTMPRLQPAQLIAGWVALHFLALENKDMAGFRRWGRREAYQPTD